MKKPNMNLSLSRRQRKQLVHDLKQLRILKTQLILIIATIRIIKGKLGFGKQMSDADFLANARAVLEALNLNTGGYFLPPFLQIALLTSQIVDFDNAITNSKVHMLGSFGAKQEAKTLLYGTLEAARDYINQLARNNQSAAMEIIEGAKMQVCGTKVSNKQDFSVKQGASTGEAILTSLAVFVDNKYYKASYDWQMSPDGRTWTNLDSTQVAKTVVTGLTPGVPMKFRKRTNSKKLGIARWCTAIDFTVQ